MSVTIHTYCLFVFCNCTAM